MTGRVSLRELDDAYERGFQAALRKVIEAADDRADLEGEPERTVAVSIFVHDAVLPLRRVRYG